MESRKYISYNLKYLDDIFHQIAILDYNANFVPYQEDQNLQIWECVDDRFSTSYGSTYEVVINDFQERQDNVNITIFGDRWLSTDNVLVENQLTDKFEDIILNILDDDCVSTPYRNPINEILQRVYPNGTVNMVGNFSFYSTTSIDLDDVMSYLQSLSTYPDYFIFNGVSKTLGTNGKNYTINLLRSIDNFCKSNGIKACCIFTDNEDIQNVSTTDYAYVLSTNTKMLKFSVFEWVTHHLSIKETNYKNNKYTNNFSYNNTNNRKMDSYFLSSSTQPNLNLNYNMLDFYITRIQVTQQGQLSIQYRELVYNVIKRFILKYLFMLSRECFYITLMYKSVHGGLIDDSTYDYYFGTQKKPYNLMACLTKYQSESAPIVKYIYHKNKYGNSQSWNMFKQDGQFVAFCLHTDFSEHLWACQQGHSNCYDEFVNIRETNDASQEDAVKGEASDIYKEDYMRTPFRNKSTQDVTGLLKERLYNASYEYRKVSPPNFPGTGCPWITISDDNRERYANKNGEKCPMEIWITRDNYTATITIRLHTEKGYPDLYQSIELGKMTAVETENYIYPLYCGGGTTGLASDIYVYPPVGGANKDYIKGNVYDLNMDNICMSNSNILHPTRFHNCKFTNFKVLTPEGIWRSIYSHEQSASVVPYPSVGPPPDYAIHLNPPTHGLGSSQDGAYPFLSQNWSTTGSQYVNKKVNLCREPCDEKKYSFNMKLDSIKIALNHSLGNGQYLSYGEIPHCWRAWDKDIPSGEVIYNGKRYLVIPCGWDGRLWDYGWHLDIYNDLWETYDVVNHFEDKYYKKHTTIEDKLVIELGDVNV